MPEETPDKLPEEGIQVCKRPMRDLKKGQAKTAAQTKVNLRKAAIWGGTALIVNAQYPLRNWMEVVEVGRQENQVVVITRGRPVGIGTL